MTPQRGFGGPGFEIHGQKLKKIYVFMNVKETETSITVQPPSDSVCLSYLPVCPVPG